MTWSRSKHKGSKELVTDQPSRARYGVAARVRVKFKLIRGKKLVPFQMSSHAVQDQHQILLVTIIEGTGKEVEGTSPKRGG